MLPDIQWCDSGALRAIIASFILVRILAFLIPYFDLPQLNTNHAEFFTFSQFFPAS